MQFRTVRGPQTGTEKHMRQFGGRGEFFVFDYALSHDPTLEGVGVHVSPNVKAGASWDYEPDLHAGARAGWEDALFDDVRLCCTGLRVLSTRDNPVDTSPHVIRSFFIEFFRKRITEWAEPIPPLRAEWLTSDVVALARGVHAHGAFDGRPALCDALLEAGCDDPLVIEHLQTCPDHGPSCWVVEMILDNISAR